MSPSAWPAKRGGSNGPGTKRTADRGRGPGAPAGDVLAGVIGWHGEQDGGRWWTSPDLSVTLTEREAMDAIHLFELLNWDTVEADLKPGATSPSGEPLDRHNRNVRLALMAECLTNARDAKPGTGIALMDNHYWRHAVSALLEARDLAKMGMLGGPDDE